jgi:hypothetical protein
MPRIAFATCSVYPHGHPDDQAAAELCGADFAVWDDPGVDWRAYDRVVVRSVWDYTSRVEDFLAWAAGVGARRLRNTPELIRFNADKRYLAQLDAPTVPTTLLEPGQALPGYDAEVVIKPNVSGGARDTGRFLPEARAEAVALVQHIHADGRAALMQPYLSGVDIEGERAVVFFAGEVSHVLHKRPVLRSAGVAPLSDEAHGPAAIMLEPDLVVPGTASEAQLELARRVHGEISARFGQPLFARVDMVPGPDGAPVLIELEAIEPMLYLELIPGAAERFAAAVTATASGG